MGLALAARLFWLTTAAICFMKQTLQRHIARLVLRPASCDRRHTCSGCVRSLLVSSPRTCLTFEDMPSVAPRGAPRWRPAAQMQVLQGSAP